MFNGWGVGFVSMLVHRSKIKLNLFYIQEKTLLLEICVCSYKHEPWQIFPGAKTYLPSNILFVLSEAPARIDGKALSATEAIVWWLPLPQSNLDGYQVSRRIPTYVILKLKTELCVDAKVFASYELLSSSSCPCMFIGEVLEDSRGQWGSGKVGGGAQQGEPYQAGRYVAKLQLPHWGSGLQLCRIRATQRAAADPHQEIPYVVLLELLYSSPQLHHHF